MNDFLDRKDENADKLLRLLDFPSIESQAEQLTNFILCDMMLDQLSKHCDNPAIRDRFYNLLLSHLKVAQDRLK